MNLIRKLKTITLTIFVVLCYGLYGQTIQWNQEISYKYSGKYVGQTDKSIPLVHNSLGDVFGAISFHDRLYFDKDSLNTSDRNGFFAFRMDKHGKVVYKNQLSGTKFCMPFNATAQHSDQYYIGFSFGGKLYFNDSLIAQDDSVYTYRNCVICFNRQGKIKWFKFFRAMTHGYFSMTDDKNGKLTMRPSKSDLGRYALDSSFFTLGGYSGGFIRYDPDGAVVLADSVSGRDAQIISSPSGNFYGELRFVHLTNPAYDGKDTFKVDQAGDLNYLFTLRDSNFKAIKHFYFKNRDYDVGFIPNEEYGKYVYVDDQGNLTGLVPFRDSIKYRDSTWIANPGTFSWLLIQFDSSGKVNWALQPENIHSVGAMRLLGSENGFWAIYSSKANHTIQGYSFPGDNPVPYIIYVNVSKEGKIIKYNAEFYNKNTAKGMRMATTADDEGVYIVNSDTNDYYTFYKSGGLKRLNITKLAGNIYPLNNEMYITNNSRISIYPNPAQDNLYIELPENLTTDGIKNSSLICTDLQGRILRRWPVSNDTKLAIDIQDFLPGVYMLGIVHPNGVSWVKWVRM